MKSSVAWRHAQDKKWPSRAAQSRRRRHWPRQNASRRGSSPREGRGYASRWTCVFREQTVGIRLNDVLKWVSTATGKTLLAVAYFDVRGSIANY